MKLLVLLACSSAASALRVGCRPLQSPKLIRNSVFASSSAAFTTLIPQSAHAEFDLMYELNRPPIDLQPFHVNPIGWVFIGLYAAYLTWQIFGPVSEAEAAFAKKAAEQAATAGAAAAAVLSDAAAEEGAFVQSSGLIYREIVAGSGVSPSAKDTVKVHYTGTLFDGTVFDSSLERGEPLEFKLEQVIAGWQEGLQLMKPGGKALLTIPSDLAYGPLGSGSSIPGNSVLRFEVELLEVEEAKPLFGGMF